MKAFRSRFTLFLLAVLCLPFVSRAQDTGYIGGTVIDKTGAAIAGAEVTIKNLAGSITRTTVSNGDGAYVIPGLPGDSYDLTVTAKGFQKFVAKKVVLTVGEKARIDVTMNVGAVTEEVVVTGESVAQVETTSSEIGSTISGKQVSQLELNGRNFTQLVTLTPGVVNQTGQDEGKVGVYGNVAYSINGGRTEYNNWELDGGDNMDNGSNSTLNVYPNVEAIAEFKVLTSNYGAQYGRNGSGTIEVETKSGGSSFHGSAFEYLRNDFFNANEYFDNASGIPRPAYKKHDFGYTIGGPVYIPHHYNSQKQKTFFFFSEEWRRQKDPYTSTPQNVPSDAERNGNFTDVCAPATVDCPNVANFTAVPITPEAQALLGLIPHANTTNGNFHLLTDPAGVSTGAPIPAFIQTVSLPTTWREELVRIDHNITNNYRLTFRYIHDSWSTITPNPLWGNGTSNFENIQTNFVGPGTSFVARLNANISPTLLNEFVASYTADHIFLTALNNPALPSGFGMGSIFNNGFGAKLPAIQLNGNNAYGSSLGQDTGYFPWNNANPTYTYRDNMTKIFGNHTFQFGAYAAFAQKNEDNSPNVQGILTFDAASGVTTGNSFADMLLGNIASYKQWNQILKYYNRYKIIEPYFNDDFRVTKKLTLNLGLRMSLFGTYRERYRNAFNFDPNAFVVGNEPGISPADGSLTTGSGTGNPLNGIVQCGGKGGTFPLLPGSLFPTVAVGANSHDGCLSGHLFNPAPRIGFAFDPKGDGKMAIRGGYGVFFEHTNGNEGNTESLEGSAPLVLAATQSNISGYANVGAGAGTVPLFPLTVVTVPNKAVWPYVQQWNLNVQKELPSHTVVSVAYVGSKGTHLTLLTNGNQLLPVPASANPYTAGEPIITAQNFAAGGPAINTVCASGLNPTTVNGTPVSGQVAANIGVAACGANADALRTAFPGFSNITKLRDEANSVYHALQVGANRSVGDLTLSVAYTYSHSIDDSSDRSDTAFVDSYNVKNNRANSTFDQRHNLTVSYVYGLPFFKAAGLSHTLLGGWQLSGITTVQTGTPFSVTNGTTFGDNAGVGNGVGTGSRPDLVGDPKGSHPSDVAGVTGPLIYNPDAFAIPTGLTFGNVGRDTLFNPRRTNFDFGLFKRFTINEKTGFDFRWETFDLFNHSEFNSVSASLGASDFLHVNGAHLSRKMQFGLRFYF
ncbi:MAG TPA: carboxypeptidase regulatory-like domain-containing protein [Candidatus Acidoferrum sp.]|nr:carboxypeptidase regulatory-like domain-containing protein [Candidatus Acidoferrum sp.]